MSDGYIKKEDILKFIEDIKCNSDIPKNYGTLLDIMRYIRKMPTYDIGKVIKELNRNSDITNWYKPYGITLEKAIEIVKSGGVADE